MIKENDRVVTLVDKKTQEGTTYPKGMIGVVVDVYADGKAGAIELWDDTGYPEDVLTYEATEVKVIPSKD